MDLSGTVIGPDGVGVRIYWVQSDDTRFQTDHEHLVLNGVDRIIGSVQWYLENYDYYSVFTLTNGKDTVYHDAWSATSALYGLGGDDTLSGAYRIDGGDGNDYIINFSESSATLLGGNGDDLHCRRRVQPGGWRRGHGHAQIRPRRP